MGPRSNCNSRTLATLASGPMRLVRETTYAVPPGPQETLHVNMQRTLLAWLLGAVSASAAADDIVVLNSGNRMSGSIVALSRGELTFSVEGARARPRPGAGRIDIDWQNVAELRSEDTFYVWLASGERHIGSLAATNGRMVVHTPEGPREVALLEVVEIEPASAADFAGRLSGSI